jgi:hypothetical protein
MNSTQLLFLHVQAINSTQLFFLADKGMNLTQLLSHCSHYTNQSLHRIFIGREIVLATWGHTLSALGLLILRVSPWINRPMDQ